VSTSIVLVDDQALLRMGFRLVLDSQPDLEVVAEAADGREAVSLVAAHDPDIVLMDVRMPDVDGVAATREIIASGSASRIIILTTFDLDEYAYAALRAGASGFLVKNASAAEMLVAVRGVLRGDTMIAPSVARRLIDRYVTGAVAPLTDARLDTLTDREREVLGLVGRGLNNVEIAEKLFLGETTVKTHVARILTKLHIRDRIQAVVVAYESGLVRPGG
jgi:DNA-binding NarL/FixJ family response regulator